MDHLIVYITNRTKWDARIDFNDGVLMLQPQETGLLRVEPGSQTMSVRIFTNDMRTLATVQNVELVAGPHLQRSLQIMESEGRLALRQG